MASAAGSIQIGDRPLHIAVGAGHHNVTGGVPYEVALTGRICRAVVNLCRASIGFCDRCYTPGDGLGDHPGPVDAGPCEVATTWDPEWTVDIFHEIHVQRAPNYPNERGVFVIYPDSPEDDDIDEDVRKHGPTVARILANATGLPVGGQNGVGIMSERWTWVGAQGQRLRVFEATASAGMRAHSCRFLSEVGCFTNAQDRAILDRADFPERQARGLVRAYASLAVARMGWTFAYSIAGDADS